MKYEKFLTMDLDAFNREFIHTHYDVGDSGHLVIIKESDKHAFIEEYVRRIREKLAVELAPLQTPPSYDETVAWPE